MATKIHSIEDKCLISWATGDHYTGFSDIYQAISDTCSYSENKVTELLCVLEDCFDSIAMLSTLNVKKEHRGDSYGTQLVKHFIDRTKDSEIRILFANFETPQADGFNLIDFYAKYGFFPINCSQGQMLMVSKEHAELINKEFLGL